MMKNLAFMVMVCALCVNVPVQSQEVMKLNKPGRGGLPLMQALENRQSDREFSDKKLSLQELSDLVWAANGVNRPESGKRTAPSAMNRQDIEVYVCLPEGAYRYDAKAHVLNRVTTADLRPAVAGGQDFVKQAPVCLVLVSDVSLFGGDEQHRLLTGAVDAGIVSQNIAVFCAATGLATVPRMSMDQEKLRKELKLTKDQHPMLNHPVGFRPE